MFLMGTTITVGHRESHLEELFLGGRTSSQSYRTAQSARARMIMTLIVLAILALGSIVGLTQISFQSSGARKISSTTVATTRSTSATSSTSSSKTTSSTTSLTSSTTMTTGTNSRTFEESVTTQNSVQYYSQDVQQTSDGGYVLAADNIALVVKLDSSGNLQWQKQYAVKGFTTQFYALRQTEDGGYLSAGNIQNSSSTTCSECAFVVKLDSSGNTQWQKTYSSGETVTDFQQTTDGGYILAGYTPPGNTVSTQFVKGWIAKLDSSGNVQWQKALGESSSSVLAYSITLTSDGGYAFTGSSGAPIGLLVVKFDSTGNLNWETVYEAPIPTGSLNGDIGYSITQTLDGGYMVGGKENTQVGYALKLDSAGKVQWARTYSVSSYDLSGQFNSVRQTADGGFVFAGDLFNYSAYYSYNAWIVRTDSSGKILWQKTYGSISESTQFQKIALASDGGFVAAGWELQLNQLPYIVKTDSTGNVNNCNNAHASAAVAASVSVSTMSAGLSISTPTNNDSLIAVSSPVESLSMSKEC